MSGWTTAWTIWIWFGLAIELPAIINKDPDDSLTEHVQKWAGLKGKPKGWQIRRVSLVLTLVWMGLHFFRIVP